MGEWTPKPSPPLPPPPSRSLIRSAWCWLSVDSRLLAASSKPNLPPVLVLVLATPALAFVGSSLDAAVAEDPTAAVGRLLPAFCGSGDNSNARRFVPGAVAAPTTFVLGSASASVGVTVAASAAACAALSARPAE
jgi:hypothetical protein